MARYIDAVNCAEIISQRLNISLDDLVDVFAEMPTADVVEVKHGEWNVVPTFDEPDCEYQAFECSCCGNLEVCEENYCYNCGAKMDGRSENHD